MNFIFGKLLFALILKINKVYDDSHVIHAIIFRILNNDLNK